MKLNDIERLLSTIYQYNSVRITQTFTKDGSEWISARCLPDTRIIELTFLQTSVIRNFDSVKAAARIIDQQINNKKTV